MQRMKASVLQGIDNVMHDSSSPATLAISVGLQQ